MPTIPTGPTMTGPVDLKGQEQFDSNADTETPASEAASATNDTAVTLLPPPPSGSGGDYPAQEFSSGDHRLTGLGPTGYDYDIVTSSKAPGYGSGAG